MVSENKKSKHVCVIGAGPSGLVSARELRKEGHSVVIFEQNHDIGGQWLYDPNVELEDHIGRTVPSKVHSSIYASLRVHSPREVLGFTGFPFLTKKERDSRRFPGHREVYFYLRDFCQWYGLRELIRFNTRVEYVGMVGRPELDSNINWVVRSKEETGENVAEDVFDAVVVASGHFSQPKMPSITGMDTWRRKQMHSHAYRVPEPFHDEVVVLVGNSFSAQEISLELIDVAKEVHVSAKSLEITEGQKKVFTKYQNLHLHQQIDSLCEDGRVIFIDGSCVAADSIIYCTGYIYSFPFLDTKGIVRVDDNRVGPLYEHTFPLTLAPSLSFVGVPMKIITFPFFESQARWIAQVLSGRRSLPSQDDMMKAIDEFYQSREAAGIAKKHTHDINNFEDCDRYADHCGFPHLEEWRKQIALHTILNNMANLETYREDWDDDELLQVAFQSEHFTQLDPEALFILEASSD